MNKFCTSSDPKRAFTVEQAANYCGVSASSLSNGRCSQASDNANLPRHTKIGNRVVYLKEDLDSWLDNCRIATQKAGAAR